MTVRQGEQDFNKVGEVDVYLCVCLCFTERQSRHARLHANERYSHNPVLV